MKPKHIWMIMYIPISIAMMYFPVNSHKFADWYIVILSGVVTHFFYFGEMLVIYYGVNKELYPNASALELLNKPTMREIYFSYSNIVCSLFYAYTLFKLI